MEELDHDLLISCSSGLGSWLEDANGTPVYCKTDDCIGRAYVVQMKVLKFSLYFKMSVSGDQGAASVLESSSSV